MKNYVKYVDSFSQKLNLHFQGREFFATFLGGMMTIGIIILSITLGLDLGNELYLKKKPNLSFNKIILPSPPEIEVEKNNMIFAITVLDDNYQVFDYNDYFEIESFLLRKKVIENSNNTYNFTNNNKFTIERINLTLTNCEKKMYQFVDSKTMKYNFQSDFKLNNLDSAKCLNEYNLPDDSKNNNKTLIISGDSKTNTYSNIKFTIKRCNKNLNINCKSDQEIENKISKSNLAFYFIDKGIDPFLFKSPYNYFINTYFAKLDTNLNKITDLFFKNSTLKTDAGLMLQDWVQETDFTFYFYREQVTTSYSEVLFEISINSSIESEFLKRFYMKIQDLASMIGGIAKISMIIGELISRFFNRHIMYTVILNKLFNFKIKTDDLNIIKTNINMNNILDKNSSNNSELSKEIVIKGNKRLNRRRSAIFLNMNENYKNIMVSVPSQNKKSEKKEQNKIKQKPSNDKLIIKNEKRKNKFEEKKLEKIRKDLDLLEPEEINKIKRLRVSKVLNTSDFLNGKLFDHQKHANSLEHSNVDYNQSSSESFADGLNNNLINKTNIFLDEFKDFSIEDYKKSIDKINKNHLNLNIINIEMKDLKNKSGFNFNQNQLKLDIKDDSIPIERIDSSTLSYKLFGGYNKPKKILSINQEAFETEYLNTEKKLLITDQNENFVQFDKEKHDGFLNSFKERNIDYASILIEKSKENNNKNSTRKIDDNFNKIKSAFQMKRRNNLYSKFPKDKNNEISNNNEFIQYTNKKDKNIIFSNINSHEFNDFEEFNKKTRNSLYYLEMKEDVEYTDNLKKIEEKKDDKSISILINLPEKLDKKSMNIEGELFNVNNYKNKKEEDSLDTKISNNNIKRFIKKNNLEITESSITNNNISEVDSQDGNDGFSHDNTFEDKNINEKKLKIIKGQLFEKYEGKKKMSINKLDPSYFEILGLTFCVCKKQIKKENVFLDECQKLMGNYLDYLRIIKFLKEFDRLKKILFSNSQLKIFSYLPKPNLRFKNNELKIDSLYGDIFMNDKENITKKKNNHIQYSKLFDSYVKMQSQQSTCDANKKINKRMIAYMDKDMKHCFEEVVNNFLEQITQ